MPGNDYAASYFATSNTGDDSAWYPWTRDTGIGTSTSTNTNNIIWTSWTDRSTSATVPIYSTTFNARIVQAPWVQWIEDDESRARRQAQESQYREERIVARQRQEQEALEANSRADRLLLTHLSGEQQRQLLNEEWFEVRGASGTKYRVHRGRTANVDVLNGSGKVVRSLCAHPRMACPNGDTMLAQKLLLEMDEASFLRTALVHNARHGFRLRRLAPGEIAQA